MRAKHWEVELPGQESVLRLSPRFLLIIVVLCGSLPFVHQAFHIDDRIYLEVADNILDKPLFPYDYSPIFEGLITPDAASHSHLPLISYYLALIRLVTGSQKEWVYHLAFLVFPLLAAMGFYDLAQRYVRFRLAAACLLVVSPAFLVLSHTLMTDVPLLAFWIFSLSRFLRIANGEASTPDWVLCGLSLLAAGFISLISAGLILLMSAYLLIKRRGTGEQTAALPTTLAIACLLALPVLFWLLWYLRAYLHYDRLVLINTFLHMSKREALSWDLMGLKALSFVLNLGATFLFPLALWYGFAGRLSVRIFLLISFLSFVPFYIWFTDWSWKAVFLFALFFSSGLLALWHVLSRCGAVVTWCCGEFLLSGFRELSLSWGELRSVATDESSEPDSSATGATAPQHQGTTALHDQALLLLWFFGILLSYLFAYYSGSVRYSLLALPPLLLWWVAALERRVKEPYFLRNLIWFGVILTGFYSLAVGYGDYRFAGVYRSAAREISSQYSQPAQTIWFTAEWGFRYYLEKAGAKPLTRTQRGARPGDIIVKPYVASPWVTLYDGDEYTQLLEQRYVSMKYPIRVLDFFSHAGFYSTGWGILPFSLSTGERWEWFNVFRVTREYEGPIPEPERHY
ncbi:glycosyltransferase family 39 protein [Acidobacteria bacterium AH-259-A15]|nr:glycosyltransferase family 39 protein [Acidobacteria bacterium AH-259-A15]